jgi:Ni/Co efflux regulator RcnB
MKKFLTTAIALCMLSGTFATAASAKDFNHNNNRSSYSRSDNHFTKHNWKRGGRIDRGDWNRGKRVDYRTYHLQKPQRGYEWRQVDGNFVLAAAVTGLIASVLIANH